MKKVFKIIFKVILSLLISLVVFFLLLQFKQPSNDRDWTIDATILPEINIDGENISIKNIRNFTYRTTSDYTPAYYDRTFKLSQIQNVWFMVEPFSKGGAAHTLLSFEFNDNTYIAISVEIRKEKGESFSALKGLMREYEIVYVIADEKDVIKLRANYRKDKVFLYPGQTTPEKAQTLFLSMITRAKKLQEKPEFYNTAINTCTTNIVSHINAITPDKIPLSWKVLLPAYSDELAYKIGLLDNSIPFKELRNKHLINTLSEQYANDSEYSKRIRGM